MGDVQEHLFDRTPLGDCFLCLPVIFQNFVGKSSLKIISRRLLFLCTSCRISTSTNNDKLFHRYFLSILYKRMKVIYEEVNSFWSCKMQPASIRQNLFHKSSMYFVIHFSKHIPVTSYEADSKVCEDTYHCYYCYYHYHHY